MFGSLEIKFPRLSGQSSSPHLMERHLPHFQPSSRRSLSCLPGWLKNSSSHLSHEGMSKFTFLFHTQRFFFFTYSKVPDSSLLQRGRGTSSGKACRQRGPVGYCNHTKFHTFFTIFDLQEPIQQATFLQPSTSSVPDWTSLVNVFSAFQHFKLQHRTLYPDDSKTTKEAIDNLVGMDWNR